MAGSAPERSTERPRIYGRAIRGRRLLGLVTLTAVGGGLASPLLDASATAVTPATSDVNATAAFNADVVWRAALEVQVGNVSDAGHNEGNVFVKVNGSTTYLNKAPNDLERGSRATYKLDLASIGTASSIAQVTLGNSSTDGICIERFVLYINDRPLVESGRLDTPGGTADCKWLDQDDGHPSSYAFTRAQHPSAWKPLIPTAPQRFMLLSTATSTVEDIVGDALRPLRTSRAWGRFFGPPVEVKRFHSQVPNAASIDLDLMRPTFPFPEVDVDLVAWFSCSGQAVTVKMTKPDGSAESSGFGPAIGRQLDLSLENRLKALDTTCSSITVTDRITMN
jgi:hypothetical protein